MDAEYMHTKCADSSLTDIASGSSFTSYLKKRQSAAPRGSHDDINTGNDGDASGYDSEAVNVLVSQLEAASDDDDGGGGGGGSSSQGKRRNVTMDSSTRHVDAAADCFRAPVLWPALQYATYMTGMHHLVHEKHRVQSILSSELARAEEELVNDSKSAKNFHLEGDINLYSLEQQRKRRANKKSPGFLSAVSRLWNTTELISSRENVRLSKVALSGLQTTAEEGASIPTEAGPNGEREPGIDKAAFVDMMVKVHHLIICPPVDRELAVKNASSDWSKDNGDDDDEAAMTYEHFVDSMFELVDIWTETSDEEEYAELSKMIVEGITTEDSDEAPTVEEGTSLSGMSPEVGHGDGGGNGVRFRFKHANDITYNRQITKQPVFMEDLQIEDDDEEDGEIVAGGSTSIQRTGAIEARHQQLQQPHPSLTSTRIDSSSESAVRGTEAQQNEQEDLHQATPAPAEGIVGDATKKSAGGAQERDESANAAESAGVGSVGRHNMHSAMRKRRWLFEHDDSGLEGEYDGGDKAARSTVRHRSNAAPAGKLLSVDRVNSAIAKVYLSKMQVDGKLLNKNGKLSWADKSRRKKHQRMDRFVLQYHIRQFGTKKLARRNLHQLCNSVTKLSLQHPRIEIFADLVGVPAMIQAKPYQERLREYRPFACSDFVLPLLTRLCPKSEKLDRWMGNGKTPVAVTSSDFLQAVREVCPHVPLECPAMVGFTIQLGRLAERLERRYRQEAPSLGNRPHGCRASVDLDEGILMALPLWSCEEEYLIMHVTLHSIGILKSWLRRSRARRQQAEEGGQAHGMSASSTQQTTGQSAAPHAATVRDFGERSEESPVSADGGGQVRVVGGKAAGLEVEQGPGAGKKKKKKSSAVGGAACAAAASAASSIPGVWREGDDVGGRVGGSRKVKKKSSLLLSSVSSQAAAQAATPVGTLEGKRASGGGSVGAATRRKKKKSSSATLPANPTAVETQTASDRHKALRQSTSDTLAVVEKEGEPQIPAGASGGVSTVEDGMPPVSPRAKQRLMEAREIDRALSAA